MFEKTVAVSATKKKVRTPESQKHRHEICHGSTENVSCEEYDLRVKVNTTMHKVKKNYNSHNLKHYGQRVRYYYDTHLFHDGDTPASLNMKNSDVIEQNGGGFMH
ncbi:unnamed protein product [Caenorhabditis sp. 36 PRJEB53466]|nr:unnamed protein product [Caenorhabditis sp. 36 PRJEB53466]